MSDLLIRGMEMPTSCDCCDLMMAEGEYGEPTCPFGLIIRCASEKQPDCPLVPVPPHGKLIDADALADVFRGFIAMYDSFPFSQLAPTDKARRDELQSALAEVINAPTIIPAEEGET